MSAPETWKFMPKDQKKAPLYRRVNTRARGVHHFSGPDAKHARNTKATKAASADAVARGKMTQGVRRGLDYTPLFRFLLSRVGQPWDKVHSEAVGRLDQEAPIYRMVALSRAERKPYISVGESSYFSGLYVDEAGVLQKVAPDLTLEQLWPMCPCCTHTFNGTRFSNAYQPDRGYFLGLGQAYFDGFSA